MQLNGDCKLLRIFIGEHDKLDHQPLYEYILREARKNGMAGCTVLRGIMSYGASSHIHSAKLIEISSDLPIVVEIVDQEEKISNFTKTIGDMLDRAGCGGLITIEKASVLWYKSKK